MYPVHAFSVGSIEADPEFLSSDRYIMRKPVDHPFPTFVMVLKNLEMPRVVTETSGSTYHRF